ncbi:MAG TPA: hypothetical protein VNJ52_09960 [Patescibacteria group bacterium]|nr:hypothetical protein [Patescibacteria group bacterium]
MNGRTALIELMLAGFFAVACIRAQMPDASDRSKQLGDFFRLSGRWERLRRSRWQWFAMVAFMLVLRLQEQLPLVLELMVAIEFALFIALPKASDLPVRARVR